MMSSPKSPLKYRPSIFRSLVKLLAVTGVVVRRERMIGSWGCGVFLPSTMVPFKENLASLIPCGMCCS